MPAMTPPWAGPRAPEGMPPGSPELEQLQAALMSRAQGASKPTRQLMQYAGQIPVDYEGMLSAYRNKYGPEGAKRLIQALPTMSREQLQALQQEMGNLSQQSDFQMNLLNLGAGGPR